MNTEKMQCKQYPLFLPFQFYNKSLVMLGAIIYFNIWVLLSPLSWLRHYRSRKCSPWHNWFVELWLLFLIACLCYALQQKFCPPALAYGISVYVLFDSVGVTFRDVVVSPIQNIDDKGSFISIDSPSRWLLTSLINVFMVVAAFAILFLEYGIQFQPRIVDTMTALYFSVVTFTTLGYGDIHPLCATGKGLVIVELSYFLFFLAVKLPIAVSVIRIETRDKP
jgi:hypothetical protein